MSVRGVHLPEEEALWRRDIERRLRALETAGRLTNASIGSGGLVVKDGGSIAIEGGGGLAVKGGGSIDIEGGGGLAVKDGGSIVVEGGDGVELSSSGLEVNGGQVVAVKIESDNQIFIPLPTDLGTTFATWLTKSYTPPAWANKVQVVAILSMAIQTQADTTNAYARILVEGQQKAFGTIRFDGAEGEIKDSSLTVVAFETLTNWSGSTIDVNAQVRKNEFTETAVRAMDFRLNTLFIATVEN